jgi:hypothetical protein
VKHLWHELNLEEVRARLATKTSAMDRRCYKQSGNWKRKECIIRYQAEELMKVVATENSRTPRTLKKRSKPVGDV